MTTCGTWPSFGAEPYKGRMFLPTLALYAPLRALLLRNMIGLRGTLVAPPPLASLSQLTRAAEQVCGEAKRKDKGIRRIRGGTLGRRIICRIYGRLVPFPWFQVHGRIHFFVRSW